MAWLNNERVTFSATMSRDTEYDVRDGQFLFMKDFTVDGPPPGREIVVVRNVNGELRRLAPVK